MKRCLFLAAVAVFWGVVAAAGEAAQASAEAEGVADPFAELLKLYPSEVVKTGPTCSIIRVELPPGVSADEIAGLSE